MGRPSKGKYQQIDNLTLRKVDLHTHHRVFPPCGVEIPNIDIVVQIHQSLDLSAPREVELG